MKTFEVSVTFIIEANDPIDAAQKFTDELLDSNWVANVNELETGNNVEVNSLNWTITE